MYTEKLTEEGIVKESKDGIATIVISNSDNCAECTAKLYCKPGNSSERSLTVKDTFGVIAGDKVRVSIKGSQILQCFIFNLWNSTHSYTCGIILGNAIFSNPQGTFLNTLSRWICINLHFNNSFYR